MEWTKQSIQNKKEKLTVGFRAENAIGIFGMQIAQEFNRLLMLTGLCIQWFSNLFTALHSSNGLVILTGLCTQWCAIVVIALTVTETVEWLLTGFSTQTRRGRPLISCKSAVYNHKTGLCTQEPRRRQRVEMIYSDLAGYSCTKEHRSVFKKCGYIKLLPIFK